MKNRLLKNFSLFILVYNVFVIVFGAFVRASGSGAGCGAHWPTCQGDVIPINPISETIIEFTHRVTSGLALIFVIILFVLISREIKGKSKIKTAALFAVMFTILEAVIGAGLVLFQLVGDNSSTARAVIIALHLINTFLLLGSLTLVFEWCRLGEPVSLSIPKKGGLWFFLLTTMIFILAASGAITALGDTLFPSASFLQGLAQDREAGVHFLIQLRVYHPLVAILVGLGLFSSLKFLQNSFPNSLMQKYSISIRIIFLVQLFLGGINVLLLAPIWMQLIHLFFADLIWINYVMITNQMMGANVKISLPVK